MPPGTVDEVATQFTAAYQALKDKKDTERLLARIKPMILTAKADGISDKELIYLINSLGLREKFYPAKLKDLRGRLGNADPDVAANDEEEAGSSEPHPHPIEIALNKYPGRAAP